MGCYCWYLSLQLGSLLWNLTAKQYSKDLISITAASRLLYNKKCNIIRSTQSQLSHCYSTHAMNISSYMIWHIETLTQVQVHVSHLYFFTSDEWHLFFFSCYYLRDVRVHSVTTMMSGHWKLHKRSKMATDWCMKSLNRCKLACYELWNSCTVCMCWPRPLPSHTEGTFPSHTEKNYVRASDP